MTVKSESDFLDWLEKTLTLFESNKNQDQAHLIAYLRDSIEIRRRHIT